MRCKFLWRSVYDCYCTKMHFLIIFNAALVRKEIQDETDRETGRTKQISPVPIHLSIYSPNGETMGLKARELFYKLVIVLLNFIHVFVSVKQKYT